MFTCTGWDNTGATYAHRIPSPQSPGFNRFPDCLVSKYSFWWNNCMVSDWYTKPICSCVEVFMFLQNSLALNSEPESYQTVTWPGVPDVITNFRFSDHDFVHICRLTHACYMAYRYHYAVFSSLPPLPPSQVQIFSAPCSSHNVCVKETERKR
jgi:hypothetical protein